MIFIVYSETNKTTIESNLGLSEYSYYFVLKEFLPALEKLGTVRQVQKPGTEVDPIYLDAKKRGEECVFLSFSPPHRTTLGLSCPTIPVFAWEFDTIPSETWFGETFQDWRYALNATGRAITHSSFAVGAVKKAMGEAFPVASIPAPVWDRYAAMALPDADPLAKAVTIRAADPVTDTRTFDWKKIATAYKQLERGDKGKANEAELAGVVYTSVLNPFDGRKNLNAILRAFCWALRDAEDAILVLKLVSRKSSVPLERIMLELFRQMPFRCRVILVNSYLNDEEYEKLFRATTYAVNASIGEGQCLPLMEYMSGGKPAISPRHTAMEDYISEANAFLLRSSPRAASWPPDPRNVMAARSQQVDTESIARAFRESYRVAKQDPARYCAMAKEANAALKNYCSSPLVRERLLDFLKLPPALRQDDGEFGRLKPRDIGYPLGLPLDFTKEVDARRYLFSGWSQFEYGKGSWSDGDTAELAFNLAKTARPLILSARLTAYVNAINGSMNVNVSANGTRLAQWRFSRSRVYEWEHVSRTAEIPAHPGGEIRIRFDIKYPTSPARLGISIDERMLGIALEELVIAEQK